MEYYTAIKRSGIMPFEAIWMDLQIIILREVSQKQISYNITYMLNLKKKHDTNGFIKQKWVYRLRKQTYTYQKGKMVGGINWEFGIDTYILLYLKQITNNNLFIPQKICSVFCNSLNGENF